MPDIIAQLSRQTDSVHRGRPHSHERQKASRKKING